MLELITRNLTFGFLGDWLPWAPEVFFLRAAGFIGVGSGSTTFGRSHEPCSRDIKKLTRFDRPKAVTASIISPKPRILDRGIPFVAYERRRISGCRLSPPEIRLRSRRLQYQGQLIVQSQCFSVTFHLIFLSINRCRSTDRSILLQWK